ncbi:hypothetical protein ASF56_12205 [Methylobacterium sp. Leaf122]|nr:hypothetical protein [Methylobacterium sp. Leaf122]KQQ04505.1 hypothetical protein ASF56_12205 [Methylobacterium sp. Leaf122]
MNPGYRPGVSYGDRYDAAILAALADGVTSVAAAERIGVSADYIRFRARDLGHLDAWKAKPGMRRRRGSASLPVRAAPNPSMWAACVVTGRRNEGPSRLARELRGRIIVLDRNGLDPSHGVACLHAAGLTLPEIERLTGVPVRAAVAAIREHGPLGGAPEARP